MAENQNKNALADDHMDMDQMQKNFLEFLKNFRQMDRETQREVHVYTVEAEKMMKNKRTTIYINYRDIVEYENPDQYDMAEKIAENFYKYEPCLRKATHIFMMDLYKDFAKDKLFYLSFYNMYEIFPIRDLKANKISKLISMMGTITKTTEVRPELLVGHFKCDVCKNTVNPIEQQFRFTEPKYCENNKCTNKCKWELYQESPDTILTDWQKLRVQENANDIPPGSMPRSIDVIVRNEQVEKGQPGDRCIFVGQLVVVPDVYSMLKPGEKYTLTPQTEGIQSNMGNMEGVTGIKSLGIRDLNYKMIFIANNVLFTENRFSQLNIRDDDEREILENMNEYEKNEVLRIKSEPNLYVRMAKSQNIPSMLYK